jgi:phytoene dehydrogenase-like protein
LPARLVADLRGFHWDDATIKVDLALSQPIRWRNPIAGSAGTVRLDADLDGLTEHDHHRSDPLAAGYRGGLGPHARSPGTPLDHDEVRRHADRVERHAPGFTATIRGRYVAGPNNLHSRDNNLVDGAINGGVCAIHQQRVFRPVPVPGRADTPIDRLYLAGASAHPGGAVHGGPGANAARAALARSGIGGALYGRAIQALHGLLYP